MYCRPLLYPGHRQASLTPFSFPLFVLVDRFHSTALPAGSLTAHTRSHRLQFSSSVPSTGHLRNFGSRPLEHHLWPIIIGKMLWKVVCASTRKVTRLFNNNNNNNNNNNIYLLQLGCHPVAVVVLHVYKT